MQVDDVSGMRSKLELKRAGRYKLLRNNKRLWESFVVVYLVWDIMIENN